MNKRVLLLVEDNIVAATLVEEAVATSGTPFSLVIVHDGLAALDYLSMHVPTLVLLDLNLPGMSGLEVLQTIKRDDRLKVVPVILYTNSSLPEDVLGAYQSHCNAYIHKPVDFDGVVTLIKDIDRFWFSLNVPPPEA